MQCPDCGQLRHDGECQPSDVDYDLMAKIAEKSAMAKAAQSMYLAAIKMFPSETRNAHEQAAIDKLDDRQRNAMNEYRQAVLADPAWHPEKTYPKPSDY